MHLNANIVSKKLKSMKKSNLYTSWGNNKAYNLKILALIYRSRKGIVTQCSSMTNSKNN